MIRRFRLIGLGRGALRVTGCDCKQDQAKLDDAVKEQNRYAVYAIRSIENASATDVTKIAPTKDGTDEVRSLSMTTKGELLIHGHKVDRDAEVDVAFRYDPGAAPDKPKSM